MHVRLLCAIALHIGASSLTIWSTYAVALSIDASSLTICSCFASCCVCAYYVRLFCLLVRLRFAYWRIFTCRAVVLLSGASALYMRLFCLLVRLRLLCAVVPCIGTPFTYCMIYRQLFFLIGASSLTMCSCFAFCCVSAHSGEGERERKKTKETESESE